MSTIKDILFNLYALHSFSKTISLYDLIIPKDVIHLIIYFQMDSFVNIKDIDRNLLFEEIWSYAANHYKSNDNICL